MKLEKRGVTLSELQEKHDGPHSFKTASFEDNETRFKKFSAVALNSRAFVDKALALHLPLQLGEDARSLGPLKEFVEQARETSAFMSKRVMSCLLPQLAALNTHDSASNPLGPARDVHFDFREGDSPDHPGRRLDLWNQMGGDLMIAMAAMRVVKMSLCDDRPDGLHYNADEDQLDETISTLARVTAMAMSELAVDARSTLLTERQAALDATSAGAEELPADFRLSARLKMHVFRPLDELSAMSSLQFGCCQTMRTIIGGMNKLQGTDTLLELTMKQACEDANMEWFRYHLRSETRRAAHDLYGFAEGTSAENKGVKEDVDVGLQPRSALRPPWVDRSQELGDWREEGCHVVIVPLMHSSLTASTIVGAGIVPGSLITSSVTPEGEVDERRMRTPVAFCFVDGRGRVLDRLTMKNKGVEIPMPPRDPDPDQQDNPLHHNVFLTDCGASLMLALGSACRFGGTVFMTP